MTSTAAAKMNPPPIPPPENAPISQDASTTMAPHDTSRSLAFSFFHIYLLIGMGIPPTLMAPPSGRVRSVAPARGNRKGEPLVIRHAIQIGPHVDIDERLAIG